MRAGRAHRAERVQSMLTIKCIANKTLFESLCSPSSKKWTEHHLHSVF